MEIPVELSLANEAQYLLLTRSSLEHLIGQIRERNPTLQAELDVDNLAARFRANFIVWTNQAEAYTEDGWREVGIGDQSFQVPACHCLTYNLGITNKLSVYQTPVP